jgi:ferredoxin
MLQLVIMPMESYNVLIECCAESWPEYEVLKNGFIIRNEKGEQEVRVACDSTRLVDFAAAHCPKVLPTVSIVRAATDSALWRARIEQARIAA